VILKGSQRAGGNQLAAHLLKTTENEHVQVHELRGFVSDNLKSAFQEAYAVSRGTRAKQFLFSLSLNPPAGEKVSTATFEAAIEAIEDKLGLHGQPRAVVFHEKEGRRHAHVVWSRIDVATMTAIPLPHFKLKLGDVSKQLYLEHGWKLPRGFIESKERNPLNFTLAEWEQAKRTGHDPKALKRMFQECWAASDSRKAFAQALLARGYTLARGDRRGYVAVDYRGEVYAIAQYTGIKTKDVAKRLGDARELPSVEQAKAGIAARMTEALRKRVREVEAGHKTQSAALAFRKAKLVERQRKERAQLDELHAKRWAKEEQARAARLSKGFRGLWDRLTGKYAEFRRQNEAETLKALQRDRAEKDGLIFSHIEERQHFHKQRNELRAAQARQVEGLDRDIATYVRMSRDEIVDLPEHFNEASQHIDRNSDGPKNDPKRDRGR
jgi:hypothetical protein